MSRIIKAQKQDDHSELRQHLFPRLENEDSLDEALTKKQNNNFKPAFVQAITDSQKGTFERFVDGNEDAPESDEDEVNLEEQHANELKEEFLKGFAEGENSGMLSEKQRVEPAIAALKTSVEELRKCRESMAKQFEKACVELAIAIAEKIVCHEVAINRETIVDVLRNALEQVGGSEILEIRLNPSDLQVIQNASRSLRDLKGENASLEGDNAVNSGGCLIKTDFGCVDATIDHQLEAVTEALREKF